MSHRLRILTFMALASVTPVFATVARAQEVEPKPEAAPSDSLLHELRALNARLDSLEQVVAHLRESQQDTTEAVDELAALRAAAAAAGAEAAGADTAATQSAPSGPRNLSKLNPEISATGDVRMQAHDPGPQENLFDVREFEFSLQAALDPYAATKIFLTYEEGAIDLEEGYAYWSGLPGGLGLYAGRIRQQLGEINRVHLHALPQTEYPLVIQEYFGEDGLTGDGARVYWLAPFAGVGGAVHELTGEVTVGSNEVMFEDGNRPSFLGHLNNFWQLSDASFFQLGFTGLYGQNPDDSLKATVFGADARYSWRPPGRELYRSLTLQGEVYAARQRFDDVGDTHWGWYAGAQYQFGRSWFSSLRFDWVEPLDMPTGSHDWQIVPNVTWYQSEWVHLRAEWRHLSSAVETGGREVSNLFLVQVVWAVGPHKHESY